MPYNIREHIQTVKNFEFLSENQQSFYKKLNKDSVLCSGVYSKKPPLISILITTNKRVETLRYAVESAINQKEFDDYEIVVVDNEAADIDTETETSKYIKSLETNKLLYYRNVSPTTYRVDTGVALLRTKWMTILHDDDTLSPWALKILVDTLLIEPEAKWIVGLMKGFKNNSTYEMMNESMTKPMVVSLARYPKQYYQESHKPTWLGSLINVERYICHGGVPGISLENGDAVMSIRFACMEEVVWVNTDLPLYNYRIWTNSCTGSGAKTIEKMLVSDYLFRSYVLDRFGVKNSRFWKYIAWIKVMKDLNYYREGIFNYAELDLNYIAEQLSIPKYWCSSKILREMALHIKCFLERKYLKYVEIIE